MMRCRFMTAIVLIACLACTPLLCAGAAVKVTGIALNRQTATIDMPGDLALSVARAMPDGAEVPAVTWRSANPAIATVDQNGLVRPVKKGSVNIVATTPGGVKGVCRVTVTRTVRRALVIGCGLKNKRFGAGALPSTQSEVAGVAAAMRVSRYDDGFGINVSTAFNQTKKAVKAAIARKFKAARPGDVSFVYLTGHGIVRGKEFYALPTRDLPISASELRKWLDPIPGTVVLVVNTCYSGAVIGKGDANEGAPLGDAFARGFLTEFVDAAPVPKGSISGAKYQILCATAANELGYTYEDGFDYVDGKKRVRYVDAFGTPFAAGIGFDYLDGRPGEVSWLADGNFDGQITHRELLAYLRGTVGRHLPGVKQTVVAYPASGSTFLLFAND